MRLVWERQALADLEDIADRAPRGAAHVYEAVAWLAQQPFPRAFRLLTEGQAEHVLTVRPFVVVYELRGDDLGILRILDARRRLDPW